MGLQFLAQGWLYALPVFVGALVLLYFLKLKRRVVAISSTFLWHRALNDLRVNSPLQRLRMNLLLLLQLLVLLGLLLALARPVSNVGGLAGSDAILLLDVSASMQATDAQGGTRFERALAEARRVIEGLSSRDRAIVMVFSDDVQVLTDLTDSKAILLAALDGLRPTDRPTRMADAIHRVRALLDRARDDCAVYVFSDGRVGDLTDVGLDDRVRLHFLRIGEETRNLGIVGVDLTLSTGLGEETGLYASVQNAGDQPQTVGVDLRLDGELIDSREVSLAPGGIGSVPFDISLFF